MYKYAITADISKMYRQILITKNQHKFQRIFWRDDRNKPVDVYELVTVTYGTSCAPYIATKCLKHLASIERDNYPIGSKILSIDFYVDDLLSGANTKEETLLIRNELINLLNTASLQLRKWASNDPSLLYGLDNSQEHSIIEFNCSENLKTLGVHWNAVLDTLNYKSNSAQINVATKRNVLSTIASIFDPLGLISPVVVKGKLFMQTLWKADLHWDDRLPKLLQVDWKEFTQELSSLDLISVPRNLLIDSFNPDEIELHGFADASKSAYGAAIYVRSLSIQGVSSNLLCAKFRITPIKVVTIPRLELCAAVLLAKLMAKVQGSIKFKIKNVYYWTDSSIVLSWIRSDPLKYKIFIANRISEIQELSRSSQWRHVNTKQNPADVVSRGSSIKNLKNNSLWWHGPPFLLQDVSCWPLTFEQAQVLDCPNEMITNVSVTKSLDLNIFDKYSSFSKLIRIVSYCRRFLNQQVKGPLTPAELKTTEHCLIKLIQSKHFETEIKQLRSNNYVPRQSPLAKLNPFLENDLLRVGGRLKYSDLNYTSKHPIILPKKHNFTKLLLLMCIMLTYIQA